ncbi:hypothetical protein DPEC_G00358880 [Dallia pectoralis]|uniref:Uncharacterized protein n=1 Tax=Dallia pectoralis TaxID=75939 RepID=A0ACC2F0K5_DALPE|nr:hypothetical protein DPEC_G00358880 [Dallia pectoralis]
MPALTMKRWWEDSVDTVDPLSALPQTGTLVSNPHPTKPPIGQKNGCAAVPTEMRERLPSKLTYDDSYVVRRRQSPAFTSAHPTQAAWSLSRKPGFGDTIAASRDPGPGRGRDVPHAQLHIPVLQLQIPSLSLPPPPPSQSHSSTPSSPFAAPTHPA